MINIKPINISAKYTRLPGFSSELLVEEQEHHLNLEELIVKTLDFYNSDRKTIQHRMRKNPPEWWFTKVMIYLGLDEIDCKMIKAHCVHLLAVFCTEFNRMKKQYVLKVYHHALITVDEQTFRSINQL